MKIVVTGAAGFIGGAIARHFSTENNEVIWVDKVRPDEAGEKYEHSQYLLTRFIRGDILKLDAIIHMGACTDTLCQDKVYLRDTNTEYTKSLWAAACRQNIPFIYASSAAVYGDGSRGFADDLATTLNMTSVPRNPYAQSKYDFDHWALKNGVFPRKWAGLRFFNVYGPTEESKGRMASMVYQASKQAKTTGTIRLFKSGEQKRDFVYVGDIIKLIEFLLENNPFGIYNVGSGKARSFNDMAKIVFSTLGFEEKIEYFDMPAAVGNYQKFTEANTDKLKKEGYARPFLDLEDGIAETVKTFPANK